ncbi:MAG: RNase adaptor protein RapZ [Deltaproteobacteria bacterium CG2_30_63_29]|nr:MAG: RNase adaptor protein RapZ [Deltaproteobacteria bacterium CG2_30_63_29]PJB40282.1 MAG: RNase adapter RapZ [Deltaproteobacteria bacterium CG_4_9_14_3_um_filter_63_12]
MQPSPHSQALSQLLVISGLGGSGKTTAVRALEDMGFYCIDNLPLPLMDTFLELVASRGDIDRVALVIDCREQHFLDDVTEVLGRIIASQAPVELVFLDAQDDVLVRRYSETRRQHPLSGEGAVRDGIDEERRRLKPLEGLPHVTIDTSRLSPHQLKRVISDRYRQGKATGMALTVMSFGFKHGVPAEADLMFDVRFLPNPYFVPELRALNGVDEAVSAYVLGSEDARQFLHQLEVLFQFLLPRYEAEGRGYLTVAIGCTGGHHRSVALVESLREVFEAAGTTPRIAHRDLGR